MSSDRVISQQGTEYVAYAGLLAEAHLRGLRAIRCEPLQLPATENGYHAICRAQVSVAVGEFTALGEANPENTGQLDPATMLGLAQLRAKAHALCDALNVPLTPIEDLPSFVPDWLRHREP